MITKKESFYSPTVQFPYGAFSENSAPEDYLFFDIETTGLSPKTSRVFLIGCLFYDPASASFEMIQFLSQREDDLEEAALLTAFCDLALTKKYLVHFNGTTFDLPYLRHRCEQFSISTDFCSKQSMDLYRELLSMPGFFRQMPDHRQKSFEALVGYPRQDQLSGKDMSKLFKAYASSGDFSTEQLLLLHNKDDVKGMLSIASLGLVRQVFQGAYEISSIEEFQEPDEVLFTLTLKTAIPAQLSAHPDFCYLTLQNRTLKVKLPLYSGTLRYFYPDYKNYYYLPFEDEAIHKSVAIYLDSSHRKKATAATCYKKISGNFLFAPGKQEVPLFRESYRSDHCFLQWPISPSDPNTLKTYLNELIKTAVTAK